MHDAGKMGVGERILNKREKFNDNEWEEIKKPLEVDIESQVQSVITQK
jgi:response regulator RpfG family c-di-GMP phosphodiesterase